MSVDGINLITLKVNNMNQEQLYRYTQAYTDYMDGIVSEEDWFQYCHDLLDKLLEENKDVLYRLRDR